MVEAFLNLGPFARVYKYEPLAQHFQIDYIQYQRNLISTCIYNKLIIFFQFNKEQKLKKIQVIVNKPNYGTKKHQCT